MNNQYVTVRHIENDKEFPDKFHVNIINYSGEVNTYGQHGYIHKRSARRAAIALAKKLESSYRQDLEYTDIPYAFVAEATFRRYSVMQ